MTYGYQCSQCRSIQITEPCPQCAFERQLEQDRRDAAADEREREFNRSLEDIRRRDKERMDRIREWADSEEDE